MDLMAWKKELDQLVMEVLEQVKEEACRRNSGGIQEGLGPLVVKAKRPREREVTVIELGDTTDEDTDTHHPLVFPHAAALGKKKKPAKPNKPDADLSVDKIQLPTIDPITKKQMTDAVRNKKCNHIYQKSSINAMIKKVGLATPPLALTPALRQLMKSFS